MAQTQPDTHGVQGPLLTIEEARLQLGVSLATMYRYMAKGFIHFSKSGAQRVVEEAAVRECKERRTKAHRSDLERARMQRRAAAHALHSLYDGRQITKPARDAFLRRFEEQVDPDGTLSATERSRRADHARKAYFTDLARRSSKSRGGG